VRALPAAAFEEVRAELLLTGIEGAHAERPGLLHRLERMEDVVRLDELL
jgi:hypothetical protein